MNKANPTYLEENKIKALHRVFNFSAGPAMLPEEVLLKAQAEMLDWHNTGMSIMEVSHRGSEFKEVAEKAEADLRELLNVPQNYHVLFLSGGATTQFAMVPLNLLGDKKKADYVDTGTWSKKAIAEAKRYGEINIAAQSQEQNGLTTIPSQEHWHLNKEAAYLHFTPNETIEGVELHWLPKTGDVPLVVDMTSNILSRPIDVSQYGVIYAGAQKNIGPAGLTIAIVRDDLAKNSLPFTPTLYAYKTHAENQSLYNTPPTFCWYMAGLVFDWMKRNGGLKAFAELNHRKSGKLYQFIDQHKDFYDNRVDPKCRSITNVMFYLRDESLTTKFLEEAKQKGMTNLKGHRVSGGVRASIYNAMPEAAIDLLVEHMADFAKRNG